MCIRHVLDMIWRLQNTLGNATLGAMFMSCVFIVSFTSVSVQHRLLLMYATNCQQELIMETSFSRYIGYFGSPFGKLCPHNPIM